MAGQSGNKVSSPVCALLRTIFKFLASLFPFASSNFQAVLTVAIGADLLLVSLGKKRFVLLSIDFVLLVTAHTKWINLWTRIHYIGRSTVTTRCPRFIGNMFITLAVAVSAAHIGACVSYGDILLHIIYMADETATIIDDRAGRLVKLFLTIVKKQ
jgi:hypothetical protein